MSDQSTADTINEAISDDPAPSMGDSPVLFTELFMGVSEPDPDDPSGADRVWHTQAVLRELTGADEEYLAALEKKKDITYGEYLTEMLACGTVSIGSVPVNSPNVINQLCLPDRDLLFLALVRATYGETREIHYNCPHCGASNDVTLELESDFPITQPSFSMKDGITVATTKGDIILRVPVGFDIEHVQDESKTSAEVNTEMIARCRVNWEDDLVTEEDAIAWARGLGMRDRRSLSEALLSIEAGPKMGEVKAPCASCGEDMPILLDWASLLLG